MEISEETIATAASHYYIFVFDEGTADEILRAKLRFNDLVNESFRSLTRTALMSGFHRPTVDEFRSALIDHCRKYLRFKGKI